MGCAQWRAIRTTNSIFGAGGGVRPSQPRISPPPCMERTRRVVVRALSRRNWKAARARRSCVFDCGPLKLCSSIGTLAPSPKARCNLTMELLSFKQAITTLGWAVTDPVVDAATIAELRDCVAALAHIGRGGARNLLDDPRIAALAAAPTLRQFATAILGDS